jgi:flavin reductase (DIM6/NTAB) family NADH-FMN oxidoreductase RutF/DNA-binding MarR family transcriptional regulator
MTTSPSFDARAFRRALGNFATGVTVVTAQSADGIKVGVTANSFNSVSLDPPLVLWSIDKRSGSYDVFNAASHFAVNILSVNQIHLSNQFAKNNSDKFAGVTYTTGIGNAPLLPDCSARFQCEKYQQIDAGDHWILIGKVVAFDDFGEAPLVYHQGVYANVLPHPSLAQQQSPSTIDAFEGHLNDNLYYLMVQSLRYYQSQYQPRQMASGLRISEARLLMVLAHNPSQNRITLEDQVSMSAREFSIAIENLHHQGLVIDEGETCQLTQSGKEKAKALWHIAKEQQDSMFSEFSAADLTGFKHVLRTLVQRSQ